ncbi:MAG: hypothetical protein K6A23_14325, partial [Butyrivibrio sp.]|nr:hypothetical protein [Butyrivibrio sp.]
MDKTIEIVGFFELLMPKNDDLKAFSEIKKIFLLLIITKGMLNIINRNAVNINAKLLKMPKILHSSCACAI